MGAPLKSETKPPIKSGASITDVQIKDEETVTIKNKVKPEEDSDDGINFRLKPQQDSDVEIDFPLGTKLPEKSSLESGMEEEVEVTIKKKEEDAVKEETVESTIAIKEEIKKEDTEEKESADEY